MIPKIIHQTWKTSDLPENFQKWHNLVKELHHGWKINLWTDEDNIKLVREHFPQLLEIYQKLEYDIMRVDMVRYMYMELYGGFYIDLDYELLTSLNGKILNTELLLPVSREKGSVLILGNCIFGSIPKHIFWKDILYDLYKRPPLKKIFNKYKILELTGPELVTKIYFRHPEKYNATLPSRNIFHPPNDLKYERNYKSILKMKGSMGIHHCEGSWLKTKSPVVYFFTKLKALQAKIFE